MADSNSLPSCQVIQFIQVCYSMFLIENKVNSLYGFFKEIIIRFWIFYGLWVCEDFHIVYVFWVAFYSATTKLFVLLQYRYIIVFLLCDRQKDRSRDGRSNSLSSMLFQSVKFILAYDFKLCLNLFSGKWLKNILWFSLA